MYFLKIKGIENGRASYASITCFIKIKEWMYLIQSLQLLTTDTMLRSQTPLGGR